MRPRVLAARISCRGRPLACGFPVPGQELTQPIDLDGAGDDPLDHVGEVCLRIDAVQFARVDERRQDRPTFAARGRAGEQGIAAAKDNGPDSALAGIVVDLDASVIDEQGQAVPMAERVSDRFSELGLGGDFLERRSKNRRRACARQ
jgi:hypothetical protein